jgi:hypothetical protein
MTHGTERLYHLLPAVYRLRDADEGEPLRALAAVMEREMAAVEADIEGLYENWFIETCEEWVVPYLGDLLGVRGLRAAAGGTFTGRARVANTIGYRRRKGTAAVLEQLARDVTGLPAHAVEYFQRLAVTQHLSHVRLQGTGTASLRGAAALELVNGPFEAVAHTGEVRHVDNGRGRYNIPHVGIWLWRLQSYPVTMGTAPLVTVPAGAGFTFDPLARDAPLFNLARTESAITHLAREEDVPGPLRRRATYDELQARRAALVAGSEVEETYFGEQPVLQVFFDGRLLEPEEVVICDLEPWRRPPSHDLALADGRTLTTQVAVDPPRGRLAVLDGVPVPDALRVSWAYGFPGDLGGGPYDRRDSLLEWQAKVGRPVTWQAGVAEDTGGDPQLYTTLAGAVAAWNAQPPGTVGAIAVTDSRSYADVLTGAGAILVPEGSHLLLVAAEWPAAEAPGAPRTPGRLLPQDLRPHLAGSLAVRGTAPAASTNPGSLAVDGLLVEGTLTVQGGNLGRLRLAHSTLVPAEGGLVVAAGNTRLDVELVRAVTGRVQVADDARGVRLEDCIVDPAGGTQALRGPAVEVEACTVFGRTEARTLEAGNSIFTDRVTVQRRQQGCVRFCSLPLSSLVPRRYECHPASTSASDAEAPQFTARRYGHPAYAQLSLACPAVITTGADDEGEMGAWHFLQQTQRIADLRASLGEHLRVGLEAGLFFAT